MNKINVIELTDTELNRAMIWLYGYPTYGGKTDLEGVIW